MQRYTKKPIWQNHSPCFKKKLYFCIPKLWKKRLRKTTISGHCSTAHATIVPVPSNARMPCDRSLLPGVPRPPSPMPWWQSSTTSNTSTTSAMPAPTARAKSSINIGAARRFSTSCDSNTCRGWLSTRVWLPFPTRLTSMSLLNLPTVSARSCVPAFPTTSFFARSSLLSWSPEVSFFPKSIQ